MMTLFTLMGDKFVESFDEKSIMAHRILAFKKLEYENVVASVESLQKDIGKSVGAFPMIRQEGIILHDLYNLETFFKSHCPQISVQSFQGPFVIKHIADWALDSLAKRARYYMLLEPDNWAKLKRYFMELYPGTVQMDAINNIRKVSSVVYKSSMFSRMDYTRKLDTLDQDLAMINTWASQNPFLAGEEITLADFAVFSVLHLLFHPYIEESSVFLEKYSQLNRWMVHIDKLSSNSFTKRPQLKIF